MENRVVHVWEEENFDLTKEIRQFEAVVKELQEIKAYAERNPVEEEADSVEKNAQKKGLPSPREEMLDRLLDLMGEQTYRDVLLRRAGGLDFEVVGYIMHEWLRERSRTILALSEYAEIGQGALTTLHRTRVFYVDPTGVASATRRDAAAPKTHRHGFDEVLEDLMMEQQELK